MSRCAVRAARAVCVCVCVFFRRDEFEKGERGHALRHRRGLPHNTEAPDAREKIALLPWPMQYQSAVRFVARLGTAVAVALAMGSVFSFFLSQHLSASVRVAVIDRVCMYASERSGPPFFFHSVAPWSIEAARPAGQQGKPDARTHAHAGHSQPTTKRHCKGGKEADTARTQKQTRK